LTAWRDTPAKAGRLLRVAMVRYTGDFLEEDAYEDWAIPCGSMAGRARRGNTSTAETADSAGDFDGSARHYLRLLDRDGLDEPAHLDWWGCWRGLGRHGEARAATRVYVARMTEIGAPAQPYPNRD
jgi:hypothetical protein